MWLYFHSWSDTEGNRHHITYHKMLSQENLGAVDAIHTLLSMYNIVTMHYTYYVYVKSLFLVFS